MAQYGGRPYPHWFSMPEHLDRDLHAIEMMAAERVKREPTLTLPQAVMTAIADCLLRNGDPGAKISRVFLDWNWYRLDCYKAARLGGRHAGIPAEALIPKQRQLAA